MWQASAWFSHKCAYCNTNIHNFLRFFLLSLRFQNNLWNPLKILGFYGLWKEHVSIFVITWTYFRKHRHSFYNSNSYWLYKSIHLKHILELQCNRVTPWRSCSDKHLLGQQAASGRGKGNVVLQQGKENTIQWCEKVISFFFSFFFLHIFHTN